MQIGETRKKLEKALESRQRRLKMLRKFIVRVASKTFDEYVLFCLFRTA